MNGVEILASEEVVTATTFNSALFCWFIVAAVVVGLVIGLIASFCEGDIQYLFIIVFVVACFGLILGAIIGVAEGTPTEYETQYKVTISDEVPMNEFLERYEIIEQEGKIYTVRERK